MQSKALLSEQPIVFADLVADRSIWITPEDGVYCSACGRWMHPNVGAVRDCEVFWDVSGHCLVCGAEINIRFYPAHKSSVYLHMQSNSASRKTYGSQSSAGRPIQSIFGKQIYTLLADHSVCRACRGYFVYNMFGRGLPQFPLVTHPDVLAQLVQIMQEPRYKIALGSQSLVGCMTCGWLFLRSNVCSSIFEPGILVWLDR